MFGGLITFNSQQQRRKLVGGLSTNAGAFLSPPWHKRLAHDHFEAATCIITCGGTVLVLLVLLANGAICSCLKCGRLPHTSPPRPHNPPPGEFLQTFDIATSTDVTSPTNYIENANHVTKLLDTEGVKLVLNHGQISQHRSCTADNHRTMLTESKSS